MEIVQPGVEYTPPPSEPTIYPAPEVSQPPHGLFGPRSPRSDNGSPLAPPDRAQTTDPWADSWATWQGKYIDTTCQR